MPHRNRLADEASLYLRQHGENPVDWYPWGAEALVRAREQDQPIFLSIGYASCHWCHVMEHEVFEDDLVAAALNRNFVCIKVDREERPDIDAAYMDALQAMTGGGGWPMSMFLTPALKPFHGATYVPRDAFLELIARVSQVFRTRRADVEAHGEAVRAEILADPHVEPGPPVSAAEVDEVAVSAARGYDAQGGLRGGMKFPMSPLQSFLLHRLRENGDSPRFPPVRGSGADPRVPPADRARIEGALAATLDAMAAGGLRDHVGGGFHRYCTDATWTVPHFEKMLYDNAQLARLYAEASVALDRPDWGEVARDTLDFLIREVQDAGGGFHASLDADSGGEEGSYYVWTPAQVAAVAGPDDGPALAMLLGVTDEGNFEARRSVVTRRTPVGEVAARTGREAADLEGLFARWRPALREARSRRTPPGLDPKIVTAWNGMTISALAVGARALGEPRFAEAARRATERLWNEHRREDGSWIRAATPGFRGVPAPAVLEDHAWTGIALLDLFAASGLGEDLRRAVDLAEGIAARFQGEDGLFRWTPAGAAGPGARADLADNATPSGGAMAALLLLRTAALTGRAGLREAADRALRAVAPDLRKGRLDRVAWLDAAGLRAGRHVGVVIAGDGEAACRMVGAFDRALPFHAEALRIPAAGPGPDLADLAPACAGKDAGQAGARAWICTADACEAPIDDPGELAARL